MFNQCSQKEQSILSQDASTTLTYFGERRTDLNVANQFQGVETYSQIRYVSYFTEMHKKKMRVVPSRPKKVVKFNIEGGAGKKHKNNDSIFYSYQDYEALGLAMDLTSQLPSSRETRMFSSVPSNQRRSSVKSAMTGR